MLRALIAVSIVSAAGSAALADTVSVRYLGTGHGRNVKIIRGLQSENVFAGQLRHEVSNGTGIGLLLNGTHVTYCSDLNERVTTTTRTYEITSVADMPVPAMGTAKAQAIYDLYAHETLSESSAITDDRAAALQIAIWEIVNDYNPAVGRASLNIDSGNLRVQNTSGSSLSHAMRNALNALFDAVGTGAGNGGHLGLINSGAQDQIIRGPEPFVVIPLPGPAAMGMAGLTLLAARRSRRA